MRPRVRIMIVEDEAIVAMDLEMQLRAMEYEVVAQASTGEDAVERALAIEPDLILMDIRLAGRIDGVEAAARIRRALDVPIVYLTAHSDDETFGRAKVTEPVAYVLKPFDRRSLKAAIDLGLFRHQTDAKLRRMERWLNSTLQGMGDGVVSTDLDGRVRYVNDVAATLTGWPAREAEGLAFDQVLRLVDGDGRPIESPVRRVLEEGVVMGLSPDTSLVARDGRRVPIQDSAAPVRDDAGRITGAVVVFRDASEQVHVQDRLHKAEEQLRHAQKMEAIGLLAGGIAHDFNNLMTVVLGYSEILQGMLPASTEAREPIENIQYAAQRAADLTRQLLAFGRRQVLNPQLLDLNEVLAAMVGMLERVIGEDIDLVVSPSPDVHVVRADRGQIEQVILNLATNARDAMPDGGRLILRTANVRVDEWFIGAQGSPAPGPYAVLEVTDTGVGMEEATRLRVFEPFYTTKEPGRGTGLGLSTVYGIVQQSGGTVHVYSEPGRGTTFRIYLPRDEGAGVAAVEPESQSVATARGSEAVLIVEDNESVSGLITHALDHLGYHTSVCRDGQEALERVSELAPVDLMLVDVVMPRMGGIEFVERARQASPSTRILFMSGYAEDAALLPGRVAVGLPFIQKPFTLKQLGQVVRQVLDAQSA